MTDALDGVREHYRATGLTEQLKIALTVPGPEDQPLTPQQLGALSHFHTRWLAATAEFAQLAGISADDFQELVHDLAMQVAAADPQFIRKEDVTQAALEREKDIQRARALAEGKPEKIVDKIAEGRMAKFYEEVCLYEQPFIKENTTSVIDLIKSKIAKLGENITVSRFVRFKVGDAAADADQKPAGETPAAE